MNAFFSKRTGWNLAENEIARTLKSIQEAGRTIINLTESNPSQCGFDSLNPRILEPFSSNALLTYAPEPKGLYRARQAVADYYRKQAICVNPDQIFLTSSTSEAYSFLFRLHTEPGDEVLCPSPSYPLFRYLSDLNDVRCKTYNLAYDQKWHFDFSSIESKINRKTKIIVIVNPNNPTGNFVTKEEAARLSDLALQHKMILISDEVFHDFAFSGFLNYSFAGKPHCSCYTLNGISKMLGLPQMKLSWMVVDGPADFIQEAVSKLELICDTFLSVNIPSQLAFPEWIEKKDAFQKEMLNRISINHSFLKQEIRLLPEADLLEVEGGWYATLRIPEIRSEEAWIIDLLQKDGVYVHPGFFFDFSSGSYFVVSLIPKAPDFRKGVSRMIARIRSLISASL